MRTVVWPGGTVKERKGAPVIPSRRNPGGVKRGEESPAATAVGWTTANGRGFLAALCPSGAPPARNDRFHQRDQPTLLSILVSFVASISSVYESPLAEVMRTCAFSPKK